MLSSRRSGLRQKAMRVAASLRQGRLGAISFPDHDGTTARGFDMASVDKRFTPFQRLLLAGEFLGGPPLLICRPR